MSRTRKALWALIAAVGCGGGDPTSPSPITRTPVDTPKVSGAGIVVVPDTLRFDQRGYLVLPSESRDLTTKVSPQRPDLQWVSADSSIVTVENGVVTGRKFGFTTLYAYGPTSLIDSTRVFVGKNIPDGGFGAAIEDCPTAEEIAFVDAAIKINFDGDTTSTSCGKDQGVEMTLLKARTYRILAAASGLKNTASAFSRWEPRATSYFEWLAFQATLGGIHFRNGLSNSFCCEPNRVIVIMIETLAFPKTRVVYDARGGVIFLGLLEHETRHIFKPHTCAPLPNIGYSKDSTLAELGAFGVQQLLYVAMSENPALTPKQRAEIATDAASMRKNSFCSEG